VGEAAADRAAASYEALFGLLAVSGMRIGEALALERSDIDLDAGLITIRTAKGDRARLVPLHPTATEALRRYASVRDRLCPRPRSRAFFLSSAGTPILSLRAAFREITTRIGLCTGDAPADPRSAPPLRCAGRSRIEQALGTGPLFD
jgi:integrase/recombinase XerD